MNTFCWSPRGGQFRQLQMLWKYSAVLLPLTEVTWWVDPRMLKRYSKWVRFSKEIVLLAVAKKPVRANGGAGRWLDKGGVVAADRLLNNGIPGPSCSEPIDAETIGYDSA